MDTRSFLKLAVLALASCVEPRSSTPTIVPLQTRLEASSASPTASVDRDGVESPLQVAWIAVQFNDHHASLRARITRAGRFDLPLTLTVTTPPGVVVSRGATRLSLPPSSQQQNLEYEYELTYTGTPSDDVLLSVDGDTEAMGVHGRAWFRFGRAEPLGPRPGATGPALVIGGRNFGAAVPATP